MGGFRKLIGGEEMTGSREKIMGSTMGGGKVLGDCKEVSGDEKKQTGEIMGRTVRSDRR